MIIARNLNIGKLMLFAVFVLACIWARMWLADRRVNVPPPPFLPGEPIPRNYWCDWSKLHDNQVQCSMATPNQPLWTTYFTMNFQYHTVNWVSYPVRNLRAGDVLIAWGKPDTIHSFGTRTRWIEMCWIGRHVRYIRCVRAFGRIFSPQSTVSSITYDLETSQFNRTAAHNKWRGFSQR